MTTYVFDKISHLKRAGLVGQKSTGFGKNGGACPDWLVAEQKEMARTADRRLARHFYLQFEDEAS
jgi:hypothetical protein